MFSFKTYAVLEKILKLDARLHVVISILSQICIHAYAFMIHAYCIHAYAFMQKMSFHMVLHLADLCKS